jgi:hypothetical protein
MARIFEERRFMFWSGNEWSYPFSGMKVCPAPDDVFAFVGPLEEENDLCTRVSIME